jgi:adenylosuccinate synthase
MPAEAVIGLQWGDEGKGRVVDLLARDADVVVRYQGGANSGHTVVVNGRERIFHQVPCGVLHPHVEGVLGCGMVINPEKLIEEVDELAQAGVHVEGRMWISGRAHVVLPYHMGFETAVEEILENGCVGTTRRGIGPAYADKALRVGLRTGDLLDSSTLETKIAAAVRSKAIAGTAFLEEFEPAVLSERCLSAADRLKPFIADTAVKVLDHLDRGSRVLLEGAQGVLLDIDRGTYPYVTSSSCGAAGACLGSGVPPSRLDRVLGVTKAYATRVGNGPFPSEMASDMAEHVRKQGNEYGATTRRPRRCGWFDGIAAAYAVRLNGVDRLVVTKLDVLGGLPSIKLCVAYRDGGTLLKHLPASASALARCEPVYEEMEGWEGDLSDARSVEELPPPALQYLRRIEELAGAPLWMVSVGPQRDQYLRF